MCHGKNLGRFYMLQFISVDSGHFPQPELSLQWSDSHEIKRIMANLDLRMPHILSIEGKSSRGLMSSLQAYGISYFENYRLLLFVTSSKTISFLSQSVLRWYSKNRMFSGGFLYNAHFSLGPAES